MTNEKKQQIIELLKDKETADAIGVISEGLVKLFESIPADEPEEKKPYDPGLWLPKADERYYEAYVGKDMIYGLGVGAENGVAYPDNCWKTSKRAIEVGKKIKFLMLVERIRDKLGDNGAPSPNGWFVAYDKIEGRFMMWCSVNSWTDISAQFYSVDTANGACEILNKMKAAGQLDWLLK